MPTCHQTLATSTQNHLSRFPLHQGFPHLDHHLLQGLPLQLHQDLRTALQHLLTDHRVLLPQLLQGQRTVPQVPPIDHRALQLRHLQGLRMVLPLPRLLGPLPRHPLDLLQAPGLLPPNRTYLR
nr:unnamed protein product [Callosobruchus analis]